MREPPRLGKDSGLLEDVNSSDFTDDLVFADAVGDLLDWYEENLLFSALNLNFRSAFIELCVHGLDQRKVIRKEDKGKAIAMKIVETTLLLLVASPEFMVDAGSVPDMTPPKIELLGSSNINLKLGEIYVESGYKASDNAFGDMQFRVTITGDVNSSKVGTYEMIYSVVDIAGNVSETVKRNVTISGSTTASPDIYWWSGADSVGNGFYQNWLGQFMPFSSGWIYHLKFGWVYLVESDLQGLWMWIQNEGWLWSGSNLWPFIWSNKTTNWLYYMNEEETKFFYDYFTGSFRGLGK